MKKIKFETGEIIEYTENKYDLLEIDKTVKLRVVKRDDKLGVEIVGTVPFWEENGLEMFFSLTDTVGMSMDKSLEKDYDRWFQTDIRTAIEEQGHLITD